MAGFFCVSFLGDELGEVRLWGYRHTSLVRSLDISTSSEVSLATANLVRMCAIALRTVACWVSMG